MLPKAGLRAQLLVARRARSGAEIEAARAAIRGHVLSRCSAWRRIAAYEPLRTEPGSVELLDELVARGIEVIVPLLLADRDLDWIGWPGREEPLGVAAIADADAVLAPALAVDRHGMRLGRGGGSYDRALARVRPGVPIAALLYDDELVERVPYDDWDVAVTAIVTPSGWHDVAP